jgi:RNA polymerase sigma factor for flagellar operon FliA
MTLTSTPAQTPSRARKTVETDTWRGGAAGTVGAEGHLGRTAMNNEAQISAPTNTDVIEHLPLVQRIVAHFMRRLPRSVQREDLVAAGTLGLFQALRSSAHTCPEMFAAYARIRIRGSILDELRRHDWSPRRRRESASTNGNGPASVTTIPGASIAPERVRVAVVSFDDLPAGSSAGLAQGSSPFDEVQERREHEALHKAVEQLPERERDIIRMRYFEGIPSKGIAQAMGLSEARISQLHARATSRLKELLQLLQPLDGSTQELKLAA